MISGITMKLAFTFQRKNILLHLAALSDPITDHSNSYF